MKKFTATLGVAGVVTLSTIGFVAPANASYGDEGTSDGGVSPSGVDSGVAGTNASAADSNGGLLPSTGGPETALLVGGAALLAVGGVALVATRRRSNG